MDILKLIGRESELFNNDVNKNSVHLQSLVEESRFLVIGGSGSIGQAVTRLLRASTARVKVFARIRW